MNNAKLKKMVVQQLAFPKIIPRHYWYYSGVLDFATSSGLRSVAFPT